VHQERLQARTKETGSGCVKCPVGEYQPESGKGECKPCGEGLTSFAGAVACHRINPNLTVPRDWKQTNTLSEPAVCRHVKCTMGTHSSGRRFVKVTHDKWGGVQSQADTHHKCKVDVNTEECLCICGGSLGEPIMHQGRLTHLGATNLENGLVAVSPINVTP
jgi:hypothetical protein